MTKYPIRHAVSFHGSIQRAELFQTHNDAFSKAFRKFGKLETFHVSGKTPTGTRARIIGDFARAEHALITNARCLTEGVDVPGIDCVLFADPRRSAVDIVQAVGRALRPATNKQFGYVIVPILHDANATAEGIFQSPAFKEILTTLRALAANDDRIIEYFRAVSQGQQRKGGGSVAFDIDERLAKRIDLTQFVREIELKCWDCLAKLSWRPFEEAREFARGLGLRNLTQWNDYCKGNMPEKGTLPPDIPAFPKRTYCDTGWISWGDWLGTGNIAPSLRKYRSFQSARAFVRSLSLKSNIEWNEYCKGNRPEIVTLPLDIPAYPNQTYAENGWAGMGDWLGSGNIAPQLRQFRSFQEARSFAHGLGLKSQGEWKDFCQGNMPEKGILPSDIPTNPNKTYADTGWAGMGDWVGTGTIAPMRRQFRSFQKARSFARSLGLKSQAEWDQFCKGALPGRGSVPTDIPKNPKGTYANKGWIGYGVWLGTGNIADQFRKYRSFKDARAFVRSLALKNVTEWRAYCKGKLPGKGNLPSDIPAGPLRTYADKGWAGMGDWLGTGNISPVQRKFRPFHEARAFARGLGLKSQTEWFEYRKGRLPKKVALPSDIPAAPEGTYADKGWAGYGDWLGTGKIANQRRRFRSWKKARAFARSLGLKSGREWRKFCEGDTGHITRPSDIPSNPNLTYAAQGWAGMGDWLGIGRTRISKSTSHD